MCVKCVPTSSRNPTANYIYKQMHQTVGNILCTLLRGNPSPDVSKANMMIDEALPIVQHVMHASIHTTLDSSPSTRTFSIDMF